MMTALLVILSIFSMVYILYFFYDSWKYQDFEEHIEDCCQMLNQRNKEM